MTQLFFMKLSRACIDNRFRKKIGGTGSFLPGWLKWPISLPLDIYFRTLQGSPGPRAMLFLLMPIGPQNVSSTSPDQPGPFLLGLHFTFFQQSFEQVTLGLRSHTQPIIYPAYRMSDATKRFSSSLPTISNPRHVPWALAARGLLFHDGCCVFLKQGTAILDHGSTTP